MFENFNFFSGSTDKPNETDEISDPLTKAELKLHIAELIEQSLTTNLTSKHVQCSFCNHKTSNLEYLSEHYYIYHFHCMFCLLTFKSKIQIFDHLSDEHKMRVKCSLCSFCTFRPLKMDPHIQEHHHRGPGQQVFKCPFCDSSIKFKSQDEFAKHMNEGHNFCLFCKVPFETLTDIIVHFENIHAQQTKCSQCHFVSFASSVMSQHISQMHQESISCKLCPSSFAKNQQESIEHSFRVHKHCSECDVSFELQQHMIHHIQDKHPQLFICDLCDDFISNDLASFKQHCQFDHQLVIEMMQQCELCAYQARSMDLLHHHMEQVHDTLILPD